MTEKIESREYEEIESLVRSEVDQGLEKFRAGDFEARVRRRLAAEKKPARRRVPLLVKLAVPAAAVLLLVLVAAVYRNLVPSQGPVRPPIDASAIAAVLRELPPFSGPAPELAAGPAGGTEAPRTGGAIESVIGAAVAGAAVEAGPDPARAGLPKVAPLTMKKRMEILFKDKVIERVLISWAVRAKEA